MNGCEKCPANAKCEILLLAYRGSTCSALRHTYGLDSDPEIATNYDRFKAMSIEEMAKDRVRIAADDRAHDQYEGDFGEVTIRDYKTIELAYEDALRLETEWLQQEVTE